MASRNRFKFDRSFWGRALFVTGVAFACLIFSPCPAGAWGKEGHAIVAKFAEAFLRPEVAARADALLAAAGGESFVAASDWADRIRPQRRETRPWHYVDIELGTGPYDRARDCPGGACVVEKIAEFEGQLANPRLDPEVRGTALKWLIHLIGDIHQPLHDADRHDHGGNEQPVIFEGRRMNLHQLWDYGILERAKQRYERDHEPRPPVLSGDPEPRRWMSGTPATWANEAHEVAERLTYGALGRGDVPTIDRRYEDEVLLAIWVQLQRAGVRLAWVLNEALP